MCVDDTFKVLCKWMFQQKPCVDDDKSKHGCCFIHNTLGGFVCSNFLRLLLLLTFSQGGHGSKARLTSPILFCAKKFCIYTTPFFFFLVSPWLQHSFFYAFWFATFWGEKHESRLIQTLSSSRLPKNSRILENPLLICSQIWLFLLVDGCHYGYITKLKKKKKTPIGPHSGAPYPT
jgi:hypothetical protein